LRRRHESSPAGLEGSSLQVLEEPHASQSSIAWIVLRVQRHDQPGVPESPASPAAAHSIGHDPAGGLRRRHDHASGAHAEAVHGAWLVVAGFEHDAIGRSGQISPPVLAVEPSIERGLLVLDPNADRCRLGLQRNAGIPQGAERVPSMVPSRKDDGIGLDPLAGCQLERAERAIHDLEADHLRAEADLGAQVAEPTPQPRQNARQTVRADVGERIDQQVGARAKVPEFVQHQPCMRRAGASVDLPVREGPCSALAKNHVAARVEPSLAPERRDVRLTDFHRRTPFQDQGCQASRSEVERRKEAAGSRPHDHRSATRAARSYPRRPLRRVHRWVGWLQRDARGHPRLRPHGQAHPQSEDEHGGALTGVQAPALDRVLRYFIGLDPQPLGQLGS